MTGLGSPWLPGPDGVVTERLVFECTVGGAGNPVTFLAWVPGEFQPHVFDRSIVGAADVPLVRPTARFWWVHEDVQGPGGTSAREGIAFQRPGVDTAEQAFAGVRGAVS